MLGRDLANLALKNGFKTNIYDIPEFDITCTDNLQRIVDESDIVVNCAAYTAVDQAEAESEKCHDINARAVGDLGRIAKDADKYIIHISTDFVFGDNGQNPLNEESETKPLSVYGASKLEGERLLFASGCKHSIIRIEWTYGKHGAHFISKIIELAEKLDSLKVVEDQFGAPTPTESVAKAIFCCLLKESEGVFHFAAKGYASRFDVAGFIFERLKLDKPLNPCSSNEFSAPAERPLNSRFDCSKIDKILDFERPDWKDALSIFLELNT